MSFANISDVDATLLIAGVSVISSVLSWVFNLKIRNVMLQNNNTILQNNLDALKKTEALKEKVISDLNAVNVGLVSIKTTVADTLMTMVESKFVREDTFRSRLSQLEDKIENVKTVVEIQMQAMHKTFDSRLDDLRRAVERQGERQE